MIQALINSGFIGADGIVLYFGSYETLGIIGLIQNPSLAFGDTFCLLSLAFGDMSCLFFPAIKVYPNAELQKKQILQDNKGKAGIYRWVNLVNGKSYVGSAVYLTKRLKQYYSPGFLKKELNNGV